MADQLSTVWPAEEHTLAKIGIISNYLKVWSRILAKGFLNREINYVDAFAGPGIYIGGQPGSPIRAIEAIAESESLPTNINLHFVEQDKKRHAELLRQVREATLCYSRPFLRINDPACGDGVSYINTMLDRWERLHKQVRPSLFFLDQFGYGGVPMQLIKRILSHEACELFVFIEANRLNHFLQDKTKDAVRNTAFGCDRWRDALKDTCADRSAALREAYQDALMSVGGADWVFSFTMLNDRGQPICWLFFATNSVKGLVEMKKAMFRVDKRFAFSDADAPGQLYLLGDVNVREDWLRINLQQHFSESVVSIADIRRYVLLKTPETSFAKTLKSMQTAGEIQPIGERIRSFTDEENLARQVRFPKYPPEQQFGIWS